MGFLPNNFARSTPTLTFEKHRENSQVNGLPHIETKALTHLLIPITMLAKSNNQQDNQKSTSRKLHEQKGRRNPPDNPVANADSCKLLPNWAPSLPSILEVGGVKTGPKEGALLQEIRETVQVVERDALLTEALREAAILGRSARLKTP